MKHVGKYHWAEWRLSRVTFLSIYSKFISPHLLSSKGLLAKLRDRIFFQFMKVRRSSFIVVGSSIKVPTKFASRVTILSSFLSISLLLSLNSTFSQRGRESSTTVNQCDSLFLPSFFLLHLSIFAELSFFSYLNFFVITSFYPSSHILILFPLHL